MAAPEVLAPQGLPERLGRYEILLPIASGGIATVYLGRARGAGGFERDVAVKLVHQHLRENDELVGELVEEAKLCARIRQPNVVPVLDVGVDPFGVYLVMEYVDGPSLSALVKAARTSGEVLPIGIGLRVLLDALEGLHAAHELVDDEGLPVGLVHRDVSPQNVLVGRDGVGRLADFGIAKAAIRISHTRTGTTKGKLGYMAPEQARAQRVDRRADVWAAGVVAWELVAGRRLFSGNEAAIVLQIVSGEIPSLATLRADVPAALEQAILSALQVEPRARCSTAAELRDRLLAACQGDFALATTAEVARYVERVLGESLRLRHEKAREILLLRAEMNRLAASPEQNASSPELILATPVSAETPEMVRDADGSTTVRAGPLADSAIEPSIARRVLSGLAGAAAAVAVAAIATLASRSPEPTEAPPPQPPENPPAAAAPISEPKALRAPAIANEAPSALPAKSAPSSRPARAKVAPHAKPATKPFKNPYSD
jgi:eukaryotic-like serine/threonine-protein kinase